MKKLMYQAPHTELIEVLLEHTLLGIASEQKTGSSPIEDFEEEDYETGVIWS